MVKYTDPNPDHDDEWMVVTCTPTTTSAEFFEHHSDADEAARSNIVQSTTTYLAKVLKQGEQTLRGNSKSIAVLVKIDAELEAALRVVGGARPGRKNLQAVIAATIDLSMETLREEYRKQNKEQRS